jgi:hypothetical protein
LAAPSLSLDLPKKLRLYRQARYDRLFLRIASLAFWLLVVFLVVSQLRTIPLPRLGDLKEITTSTTFAWALLLGWGMAPAALALAAASVVADALHRRAIKKVAF